MAAIYYFIPTVLINLENLPTSSLETHSGSSDGAVSFPYQLAVSVREDPRSVWRRRCNSGINIIHTYTHTYIYYLRKQVTDEIVKTYM